MASEIRKADAMGIPAMVALSERARAEFEKLEPDFFRKAQNSATAQSAYFEWQLRQPNVIAFVHDHDGTIDGFAIAALIQAPPVYDPDGRTALIDDFAVASPELWDSVGEALFREVAEEAKRRGAVGAVAICAHRDTAKREFVRRLGMRIVSEWHFTRL